MNSLSREEVKQAIHGQGLAKTDKLLLCLAEVPGNPRHIKEVRAVGVSAGIPGIKNWNISALLSAARGRAIRTPSGWELTTSGWNSIASLVPGTSSLQVAHDLRKAATSLADDDTRRFVEEAVACFENGQLRAAVVLSWVGAISLLYEYTITTNLSAFNTEAKRRFPKWRSAVTRDDLGRMRESDFIDVLEGASILAKSVRDELQSCLRFRNGCGHPNSMKIGQNRVSAHIESLILNVFSSFG